MKPSVREAGEVRPQKVSQGLVLVSFLVEGHELVFPEIPGKLNLSS